MRYPTERITLHREGKSWTDGHNLDFCSPKFDRFWQIPRYVDKVVMTIAPTREDEDMLRVCALECPDPEEYDPYISVETEPCGDEQNFDVFMPTWDWLDDYGTAYVDITWNSGRVLRAGVPEGGL